MGNCNCDGTAHVIVDPDFGSEGFAERVQAEVDKIQPVQPKFEFKAWPKTTRLFREITVTEKLDGTNSAIQFDDDGDVAVQSRKRLITPDNDNYGFARWVHDNQLELFDTLGPGIHFGEFWGKGVQRNYGLDHRRFSLFNTAHWLDLEPRRFEGDAQKPTVVLDVVPILYQGVFSEWEIRDTARRLAENGSVAAPGFMNPEGVTVFNSQTRLVQKYTLDDNDDNKWKHE